MIKTIVSRYPGRCARTGKRIPAGSVVLYDTQTKRVQLLGQHSITLMGEHGPKTYYRNAAGRCEDAPCCGCCNI